MTYLETTGRLILRSGDVEHSSPHCWRCSHPLIYRVTPQWFINLDKNDLFDRVIKEIDTNKSLSFSPARSKTQFSTTIASRPREWCISRQRKCKYTLLSFFFFSLQIAYDDLYNPAHTELSLMSKYILTTVF